MRAAYILSATTVLVAMASMGEAQVTVPAVTIVDTTKAGMVVSPAEATYHLAMATTRAIRSVRYGAVLPTDSVQKILTDAASTWIPKIASQTVRGMQLDPYGVTSVAARHDTLAQRQIATRLATPGLSAEDKAYTYQSAVLAFATGGEFTRLAAAERYMTALDDLGPRAARHQYFAHRTLARTYYHLGHSADVVRHGTKAIAALGRMEFIDRRAMFNGEEGGQFYAELVSALSGESNASAKIAALNAALDTAATPPTALLSADSGYSWKPSGFLYSERQMVTVGARVGTHAQDIVGNYWVNVPATGATSVSHTIPMADGKIHIVEFGEYTCPYCIASLAPLQRLQDRFPEIRVVYVTATEGSWGNRLVEPAEEAAHLTTFYTQTLNVRFPISLWNAKKVRTEDGGMVPESSGPNFANYPIYGKPNFYVIDGTGRIRRVITEGITPDHEAQLAELITFLKNEASSTASRP